jgi:ribonuclease BN (tRNA processing enzyme)
MKLAFLGTNGWYSDNGNNTICTFLETETHYIVFDAGDGLHKLDRFIKEDKPIILFLSHLHIDHIIGFHVLPKFNFSNSLTIYCPKGTKKQLEIIGSPFTAPFHDRIFPISLVELEEGKHDLPFPVECRKIFHADLCFGYRLTIEEKTITYLCDTGLCDGASMLAKKADVVIHECSNRPNVSSGEWGHVNPEEVARMAKAAGVKKLILTHFSASQYLTKEDKKMAQDVAHKIFENTHCAQDDEIIEI